MNDASLVRRFERFTDVPADVESFVNGNRTTLDAFLKRLAFYEFEHQESGVIRFLEVVDGGDIGMIEGRENFGFTLKPANTVSVSGKLFRQYLDRNFAFEP